MYPLRMQILYVVAVFKSADFIAYNIRYVRSEVNIVVIFERISSQTQHVEIHLNKKLDSKEKTIKAFNIEPKGSILKV